MPYEPVIGLEIHAQLLTDTKIFCGCSTRVGGAPNTNVCPVCLGLPGALPVLNRRAVDLGMKAGAALDCTIQERSIFARKNYFYPDLPKGYQISQYEQPLATDGALEYMVSGVHRRIGIIRVHLEEDAGKSLHEGFFDSDRRTYVDFNRSGVPLIEIVTQPELRSPAEAADFFRRLRQILMAVGVNDGNMEEGSLRCDANVSVRPVGARKLGTRVEVKNLNSFKFLDKTLEYEIDRQIAVLEQGGVVVQETRLWDAAARQTVAMRSKEEAHDYRYFPEPDLPPVQVGRERIEQVRVTIPELPEARKRRIMARYGLSELDVVSMEGNDLTTYFEETAKLAGSPKAAFNWVTGELARKMNARAEAFDVRRVSPAALAGLIRVVDQGTISASVAKTVFDRMYETGCRAEEVVQSEGLAQIADESALLQAVRAVMDANPGPVGQYRAGRTNTFGFLVGQVMKATGGQANPRVVNDLLRRELTR
jgi:aspartyl-tRNA(Asn)/glutamyl-tRNA(Gln) amidotransferase subunit B